LLPLTSPQFFLFVIALSMAYCFSSIFPAVLLGVPNEDTALNVLPGHRLVLEGNAYPAILVSLAGGLLVVLFSIPFLLFFINFLPKIYPALQAVFPYVMLAIVFLMVLADKKSVLIIIALSSVLGFLTFNFNLLLPLLTGFFGLSTIIVSLSSKTSIPPQMLKFNSKLSLFSLSFLSFISSFLSSIFGFIPTVSSAIVGTMASYLRKFDSEEFLVLLSSTNVAYMSYSFFALSLVQKTRSGSAVFLSQLSGGGSIFFILGIILLSSALSFSICFKLAKPMVRLYKRVNYRKLSFLSIFLLVFVNFALAGPFGLLVLMTSTSIGLLANSLGVKRTACMSALIAPTIAVLL